MRHWHFIPPGAFTAWNGAHLGWPILSAIGVLMLGISLYLAYRENE